VRPHLGEQPRRYQLWRHLDPVDQRISGSAVDGAPTEEPRPDANNARRQRPAPEGNWRVPCSCLLCWNTRGCPQTFQHVPRSSVLCRCINKFLYRQANAVWGRYPTACMYARGSRGVFVGLVALGLFHALSPKRAGKKNGNHSTNKLLQTASGRDPPVGA
jgi:hypothetical protein